MDRPSFEEFMNQFRLAPKSKGVVTHALLGMIWNKWGSFHVPDDREQDFFDAYEKYVFESKYPCYMVERPRPRAGGGVLKFDLDMLFTSAVPGCDRLFDPAESTVFVKIIHDELQRVLIDCQPESLLTYVLFRPAPYNKSEKKNELGETRYIMKDGIHILLPHIFAAFPLHHHLRAVLIEKSAAMQLSQVFKFENALHDFVDAAVIENSGLLMYGSTKIGVEPYRLYEIFDADLNPVRDIRHTDRELTELLSIRRILPACEYRTDMTRVHEPTPGRKKHTATTTNGAPAAASTGNHPRKRKAAAQDNDGDHAAPRCKAPSHSATTVSGLAGRETDSTDTMTQCSAESGVRRKKPRERPGSCPDDDAYMLCEEHRGTKDENLCNVCKHVYLLSPSRALSYDKWIHVGLCLHNVGVAFGLDVFPLFVQFSRQEYSVPSSLFTKTELDIFLEIQTACAPAREEIHAKYVAGNPTYERDLAVTWESFAARRAQHQSVLGFGSLVYWARLDSPENYQRLLSESLETLYKEILLAPSHKKLAALLFRKYENHFLCSDYEGNVWYQWENHCWRRMDGTSSVRRKITGTCKDGDSLVSDFVRRRNRVLAEKLTDNRDIRDLAEKADALKAELDAFKERHGADAGASASAPEVKKNVRELSARLKAAKEEVDKVRKEVIKMHIRPYDEVIQRYLETTASIDSIIKEAKQEFLDVRFNRKLNANPQLFLFHNGVFDLEEMLFRDGVPTDYLSIEGSTDQPSYKVCDLETSPEVREIMRYFEQVITDPEKREFFLTLVGSCLEGHNTNNIFPILTGSGSNAKSLTFSFIEETFGIYAGKLNPAFLTQRRNKSNSASPEIHSILDCRIVSSEESEVTDELNTAIIKEITGNSRFTSRTLYQSKMTTKIPQFTPFLICNDLPNIQSLDGGTWRRIVVISFDSKFVDDPDDPKHALNTVNSGKIFLVDRTIKQKMEKWREPFMYVLIHKYYRKFKDSGKNLRIPECVRVFTDRYKDDNDLLQPFIEMFIIVTNNPTDSIKMKELYARLLLWFRENFHGEREPSMPKIKKYFEQRFGTYESRGWVGKRFLD